MQYETYNFVTLTGTVMEHTKDDKGQNFILGVNRLSGQQDRIPVIVHGDPHGGHSYSESANAHDNTNGTICNHIDIADGDEVTVRGIFASQNKIVGDRSKLILCVNAQEITSPLDGDYDNPNCIELVGFVCKAPIYRTTPFNREISDMLIAVNRSPNKSDYIPCIAWGKNARFAKNLLVGEQVHICGRIQSREYQKRLDNDTIETRTAYEVSINVINKENE